MITVEIKKYKYSNLKDVFRRNFYKAERLVYFVTTLPLLRVIFRRFPILIHYLHIFFAWVEFKLLNFIDRLELLKSIRIAMKEVRKIEASFWSEFKESSKKAFNETFNDPNKEI